MTSVSGSMVGVTQGGQTFAHGRRCCRANNKTTSCKVSSPFLASGLQLVIWDIPFGTNTLCFVWAHRAVVPVRSSIVVGIRCGCGSGGEVYLGVG